jgi:hypothetical protein
VGGGERRGILDAALAGELSAPAADRDLLFRFLILLAALWRLLWISLGIFYNFWLFLVVPLYCSFLSFLSTYWLLINLSLLNTCSLTKF